MLAIYTVLHHLYTAIKCLFFFNSITAVYRIYNFKRYRSMHHCSQVEVDFLQHSSTACKCKEVYSKNNMGLVKDIVILKAYQKYSFKFYKDLIQQTKISSTCNSQYFCTRLLTFSPYTSYVQARIDHRVALKTRFLLCQSTSRTDRTSEIHNIPSIWHHFAIQNDKACTYTSYTYCLLKKYGCVPSLWERAWQH